MKTTVSNLSTLIEALQIFITYGDVAYPTDCEHDLLRVMVDPSIVSDDHKVRLEELGFIADDSLGVFESSAFGSA